MNGYKRLLFSRKLPTANAPSGRSAKRESNMETRSRKEELHEKRDERKEMHGLVEEQRQPG